jgi:hypothetical protein
MHGTGQRVLELGRRTETRCGDDAAHRRAVEALDVPHLLAVAALGAAAG